jgi:bacteriorhodopsin
MTLLVDEIMIVCGLIGALTRTRYKWGFYTFGMAALFFIAYELLFDARQHANRLGGDPKKTFKWCGLWLLLLWFLYPVSWGLSEGGNIIHPDSEAIFYGVLDIMAKVVFAFLLLWGHRKTPPRALGLNIRDPEKKVQYDREEASNMSGSTTAAGPPNTLGRNV